MRFILKTLTAIGLLSCISLAVMVFLVTQPPAKMAGMTHIQASAEAAAQVKEKIAAVDQTVQRAEANGQSASVSLEVTQEEATSLAAETIADGKVPLDVKNVQVNFRTDRVIVSGIDVPVVVEATVKLVQGAPVVKVESVDAGRLGIPETVRQQIETTVGRQISPSEMPFDLTNVKIGDGTLTLQGVTH